MPEHASKQASGWPHDPEDHTDTDLGGCYGLVVGVALVLVVVALAVLLARWWWWWWWWW
jgi:hypothetical protein